MSDLLSLFCPECKTTYDDEGLRICPHDGTTLYTMTNEPDLAGSVIDGRFRIDRLIGHGGMGTVYEAQQLSVGRQVAVKVLRSELSNREVALERFFREAKMISGLSHPNIVKLIDFGQDRDRDLLYLVMEFVKGTNLGDIIGKGRLRIAVALEVLYQVCGALTEPHAINVIHRDLKPDNLLLVPISDGSLQAKVLDFGISRAVESNTQLTGSGMICGTPAYMAPEQAQNEPIDPRADIYALGVILYEMVSGWPPFSGTSSLQIMLKHIAEEPRPLRELIPPAALPPQVEQLVADLMSKDRTKRPKSVQEVRKKIESIRKTFGLEIPVVTDPTDLGFSEFLLPKLPEGRSFGSSPTEALRRETGLELWATKMDRDTPPPSGIIGTNEYDTEAEPGLGPTMPLTPEGKESVLLDVPSGNTKDHGQQAWTPSAQHAVQRIKDTNENEIENDAPPSLRAEAPRLATSSSVEPAMKKPSRKKSNIGLFLTMGALLAAVVAAVWLTVGWVQNWADGKALATPTPEMETTEPVLVESKEGLDPKQLEIVRAVTLAHVALHQAAGAADSSAARKNKVAKKIVKKATDKSPVKQPEVKKDPKNSGESKKPVKKTDDFDHIRNMLRDGAE